VSKLISSAFGHPVRCGWPEQPNVAGIAWLPSGNVLVAAEIENHSNCDSFGTLRAFEVDPTCLTIVSSYSQLEAKRRFGSLLGLELRDDPDGCIRKPKSCFVSSNHPEVFVKTLLASARQTLVSDTSVRATGLGKMYKPHQHI
jgi:hypothetical protein